MFEYFGGCYESVVWQTNVDNRNFDFARGTFREHSYLMNKHFSFTFACDIFDSSFSLAITFTETINTKVLIMHRFV